MFCQFYEHQDCVSVRDVISPREFAMEEGVRGERIDARDVGSEKGRV